MSDDVKEKIVVDRVVSPSMHPESIQRWSAPSRSAETGVLIPAPLADEQGKPNPAIAAGKAALDALYTGLSQCEAAVTTARQQYGHGPVVDGANIGLAIPEDRANQLAADLGVKFASVARSFDQGLSVVSEQIEKLTAQVSTALTNPKRDAVTAQEASDIRKFVAAMPDASARLNWLHERLDDRSHDVIAAVLASPWAAGLDRKQVETLSDLAGREFAPVQRRQLDACRELHQHLVEGSQRFVARFKRIAPALKADSPAVAAAKKLREG